MSRIVRNIAALFFPVCLVFGFYVILHGHLTPGGGFQGGAVVATGAALLLVAGLFPRDAEGHGYHLCEALGLCLFLFFALGGLAHASGSFFHNWLANAGGFFGRRVAPLGGNPGDLRTAGTIAWMNIAVGIEVLGGITVILFAMRRAMHDAESGGGATPAEISPPAAAHAEPVPPPEIPAEPEPIPEPVCPPAEEPPPPVSAEESPAAPEPVPDPAPTPAPEPPSAPAPAAAPTQEGAPA